MNYHIHHDGQKLGPFTEAELRAKVAQGEIALTDLAWREGLVDWLPVGKVLPPELPSRPPASTSVPVPPALVVPRAPSSPSLAGTGDAAGLRQPYPGAGRVPGHVDVAAARKKRLVWPWVLGAVVLGIFLLFGVASFTLLKRLGKAVGHVTVAEKPIMEERAAYRTVWKKSSFEPVGPADVPPAGEFEVVHYPAEVGKLVAYVTPDPKDGKKHPAIVWAHGGFGGIGSYFWEEASKYDDQSARAFREAGIVMMAPSWRAENDNPGRFELFYGEVNDLLAAVAYVKTLPYVDPERVYIGGHSTGGTLTLLASVASGDFRAAFSFGGMANGRAVLAHGEGFGNTPYDSSKVRDSLLRSPVRYTRSITRPTFFFEGADNPAFMAAGNVMATRAAEAGVPFQAFSLPGTHFDILHPITPLIARKILADTGATCNIDFTNEELLKTYNEAFPNSPQQVLARWSREGGDLKKILEELPDEDTAARREADVDEITAAIERLAKEPASPTVTGQIAALAGLCENVMEDEAYDAVEKQVIPALAKWARTRLDKNAPFTGKEEPGEFLQVLQMLLDSEEKKESLQLLILAARQGVGSEEYTWTGLFRTASEDPNRMDKLVAGLGQPLPEDFIAMALLDAANAARLKGDWKGTHPFDNDEGVARFKGWLEDTDPEHSSYAHSAAVGLAHISAARRASLLALALKHPDHTVQLEAAWADLKNAGSEGLAVLQKACLDVHQSSLARRYLVELEHGKDVPAAAKEPTFAAKAAMSEWLQHPNEVGAPPLTLEVYDQTELYWPPRKARVPVWLFKYTYRFSGDDETKPAQTAYGMVGGMTWSFFGENTTSPTPESLYVRHCALELQHAGEDEDEVESEEGSKETTSAKTPEDKKKELTPEQWAETAREALAKGNPGRFEK